MSMIRQPGRVRRVRRNRRLTGVRLCLIRPFGCVLCHGLTINIPASFSDRVRNVVEPLPTRPRPHTGTPRSCPRRAAWRQFDTARYRRSSWNARNGARPSTGSSTTRTATSPSLRAAAPAEIWGACEPGLESYFRNDRPGSLAPSRDMLLIHRDWANKRIPPPIPASRLVDNYLYVTRESTAKSCSLRDEPQETVTLYPGRLESGSRPAVVRISGLIYLWFSAVVSDPWPRSGLGLGSPNPVAPVGGLLGGLRTGPAGRFWTVRLPEESGGWAMNSDASVWAQFQPD